MSRKRRELDEAGGVVRVPRRRPARFADTAKLLEVLRLIADGYTNPMIAQKLYITEDGVKSRVRALLDTLQAVDRAHAVHIGHKRGILHHDEHAQQIRRDIADRHASTCAMLQIPECDCKGGGV